MMFKKLFGGNREDQDEYIERVKEMNKIIQSDMDEENKRRIIQNLNDDIKEDYE